MYSFLHKIFMYVLYMICNTIYGVWTHIQCINYTLVRVSLTAQLVKNPPAMQEILVWLLVREDTWRRDMLPTPVFLGFPGGSGSKQSTCSVGDLGSIPRLGRSPGEGKGYPLHGEFHGLYSIVHGVTKSRTWLSDFLLCKTLHFQPLNFKNC